ncbi:MAG: hypothetical protein IKH14_03105 [Prevotella sp.]|nr:hypothetical protein [Prevotella sp.]
MGLIGSAIGAGASLIGGMFAGRKARKAYNAALKTYKDNLADIKAHRDNIYYQDPTQSAEAQAAVTNAQEVLDDATQKAVAGNVIAGGSDESVALQKAAAAATVGKMMQEQAVQGAAKKEGVWNNAQREIDQMNSYIASTQLNKGLTAAKNITAAASGVANAANDLDFGTTNIGKMKVDW